MSAPATALQPKPKEQSKRAKVRGVFERKPGEFWIRYADAQGRYRREKAGTKGNAIALYRKRKIEALEGKKLPEKLRSRAASFAEIADDAITYITGRYARPADDVARMEVLKDWFAGRGAESITPQEVEARLERGREENDWTASTVNHHHTLLSLTYRLAIRNRKVKESPVRGLRRRPEDNSRVRFLTADEEKRLREAIRSKPEWAEHEPELDLALHTGLRRTDMYQRLIWENVNVELRVATVTRSKNDAPVHVPLNDDAMRALRVFRLRGDGTGRVVRNAAGETLTVNAHWFPDAVRAAGIKDFRWHDCRHTFASRLRQSGTPLGNIGELLGHKTLAMSRRYAHLSIANLHEAVSRIATSTTVAPEQVAETPKVAYLQ
jgi:site-specific recombinase XerD